MKPQATAIKVKTQDVAINKHRSSFAKVVDGRKNPIRGLWQRNSQFYAQLEFVHPESGEKSVRRVKLVDPATGVPVRTIPQAVGELARLRLQRSQNALPVIAQAPRFKEFGETYLAYIRSGASSNKAAKKPRTIEKEEYANLRTVLEQDHPGRFAGSADDAPHVAECNVSRVVGVGARGCVGQNIRPLLPVPPLAEKVRPGQNPAM